MLREERGRHSTSQGEQFKGATDVSPIRPAAGRHLTKVNPLATLRRMPGAPALSAKASALAVGRSIRAIASIVAAIEAYHASRVLPAGNCTHVPGLRTAADRAPAPAARVVKRAGAATGPTAYSPRRGPMYWKHAGA